MTKRVLFAVIILASVAAAAYTLYVLDMMVYGTFYSYGLRFNDEWATPYWNLLKIMWALLTVIAATTIVSTLFSLRKLARHAVEKPRTTVPLTSKTIEKAPIRTRTTERPPDTFTSPSTPSATAPPPLQTAQPSVSRPISAPTPITHSPLPQPPTDPQGVFRCGHCGKNFTQPLRMLDFNSERPRIVNICPFCNEIANTTPQKDEKNQKQNGKSQNGKNNHMPRTIVR